MNRFFAFLSLLFTLTLFSCNNTPQTLDGKWAVVDIEGESVTPSAETPFIAFEAGNVVGFTGCNSLSGTIDAQQVIDGRADFSKVAATMMLCPEDKYETRFLTALSKVSKSEVNEEKLILLSDDGTAVLTLEKQK